MEPAFQDAASPLGGGATPAAVAEEGLHRFQEVVATQIAALRTTLVASFEREVLRAAEQAAEAERVSRLAAEVDVRRLELEVEGLRAENGELTRRSPPLKQSPSDSCSEAEEVEGHPGVESASHAARPDNREPPEDGAVERLALPVQSGSQATSVQGTPRTAALAPGGQRLPLKERPEMAPNVSPPVPPSRIPKPSRAVKSATDSFEERWATGSQEADDQQRKVPIMRPCSGSPVPVRSEERSSTPHGVKSRGRRPTQDDDMFLMKLSQAKMGLMQDKRTLRKIHREAFRTGIQDWRENHKSPGAKPRKAAGCQVFVRLRPMFEKEWREGEFEAVTAFQEWGEVVVHNCLFQADLVRMFIQHVGFCFPRTFAADASNEDVYAECGAPLVAHALTGQLSTIFMFGQTGSGKTYTMSSIIELAAQEIFSSDRECTETSVRLRAFEIAGKKCFDLLSRPRAELKLLDSDDGRTKIVGAVEAPAASVDELQRVLREAFARRATASHGRNEESSRSHCICIVELPATKGSLVLVDCAGTERRQDTDQHSAERTKESAEINTSLHALKECIRYRAKEQRQAKASGREDDERERPRQVHVPYRGSYLTRVLHESFTRPGSRLCAIGTVAPAATDAEHTLSTLRTLQLLLGDSGSSDAPTFEQRVDVDPKAASLWSARSRRSGGSDADPRVLHSATGGTHRRRQTEVEGSS